MLPYKRNWPTVFNIMLLVIMCLAMWVHPATLVAMVIVPDVRANGPPVGWVVEQVTGVQEVTQVNVQEILHLSIVQPKKGYTADEPRNDHLFDVKYDQNDYLLVQHFDIAGATDNYFDLVAGSQEDKYQWKADPVYAPGCL